VPFLARLVADILREGGDLLGTARGWLTHSQFARGCAPASFVSSTAWLVRNCVIVTQFLLRQHCLIS